MDIAAISLMSFKPLVFIKACKNMDVLRFLEHSMFSIFSQIVKSCANNFFKGWSEGLVYLLRKGARPDVTDNSGRTPLHAATYDTDVKSLVTLIKHLNRDDINIGDNEVLDLDIRGKIFVNINEMLESTPTAAASSNQGMFDLIEFSKNVY